MGTDLTPPDKSLHHNVKSPSPQRKLILSAEKSINKSNICTNNSFIYINISFILTNISFIYTFLRRNKKFPARSY